MDLIVLKLRIKKMDSFDKFIFGLLAVSIVILLVKSINGVDDNITVNLHNHKPIIISKSYVTWNHDPLPPGISRYFYSTNNSNQVEFMDSSYKYSVGDTITGKMKEYN